MDLPAATERLRVLQDSLPFGIESRGELVESWSNDAWVFPESVLRVCWQGDPARILKEAAVLEVLPDAVPHARVIEAGERDGLAWTLLARLPGRRLDLIWSTLSGDAREQSMMRQGEILRELHRWSAPTEVAQVLGSAAGGTPGVVEIVGSQIVPLPIEHAGTVLEALESEAVLAPKECRRLRARLDELSALDPTATPNSQVVVHADAHFANYLHDGSGITALLDFEWVTLGPPELELTAICRNDPEVARLTAHEPCDADEVTVLRWLGRGYPELLARENLTERFWLLELVHHIRELHTWPREASESAAEQAMLLSRLSSAPRIHF